MKRLVSERSGLEIIENQISDQFKDLSISRMRIKDSLELF